MEKRITDKIKDLQAGAANQEEFMKNLAELDENGQINNESLRTINGGASAIFPKWLGFFIDKVTDAVS